MTWHRVCLHSTCKRDQVRLDNFTLQCSYRPTYTRPIADNLVTVILHVGLLINNIWLKKVGRVVNLRFQAKSIVYLLVNWTRYLTKVQQHLAIHYIEMDSALRELPTINYIEYC